MAEDESAIKLADVLPAVDRKDRDWWGRLKQAQKDKFPAWLYMRYASNVEGNADFARYYLMAVNETVNKHFNTVRHHPKLQYMLMTAASPGMGTQRHGWIPPAKRGKSGKKDKLFSKLYPNATDDELEILAAINDDMDVIRELEDRGWTQKDIKAAMKGSDE
jgi:hypothetical protein